MASISSIHDASWNVITFEVAHEQAFERSQQTEKLSKQYKEKRSPISTSQKEISLENLEQEKLDINIELYSAGFFDGLTGLNAELPHLKDYWDGYALGYREYGTGLLGLEIPLRVRYLLKG